MMMSRSAMKLLSTATVRTIHGGGEFRQGFFALGARNLSSTVSAVREKPQTEPGSRSAAGHSGFEGGDKSVVSYWGVAPVKLTKEDGTEWKWSCFKVSLL